MRNKARNKILAFALAAVMLFMLLPGVTVYAEEGADGGPILGESGVITAFDNLPQGVAAQTVPLGTSIDALTLPGTLEAAPAEGEDQEETPGETAEITVQIPVVLESAPQYNGDAGDTYIFTARLPGGYAVAEGLTLPVITVTVEADTDKQEEVLNENQPEAPGGGSISAFAKLPEELR